MNAVMGIEVEIGGVSGKLCTLKNTRSSKQLEGTSKLGAVYPYSAPY
jgi:hypothetical protein